MDEIKVQNASEEPELTVEGLGPKEAKAVKELLVRFMREYKKKPAGQSDEEWLTQCFRRELPHLTQEEAEAMSRETVEAVREYDKNLQSLKEAQARGVKAEDWFADKVQEAAVGVSAADFGRRMLVFDQTLENANAQMRRVITTQSGEISQCLNLDGFIAEQHHVNTFNANATAGQSPFRAEVCAPGPGETYGKNSFDIVIKDRGGHTVHQYQCKYGADAKATIQMLKDGNYNNQVILVPPEQVAEVQAAFPGKTVTSTIGGTDKVSVESNPLSKQGAKEKQILAQEEGITPTIDWGSYDSRMLAKAVGKEAFMSGIQGAAIATGFTLVAKLAADEPIEADEMVATALQTGADAGVKTAAAGAVKVASERGVLSIIPPGTPIPMIANVVCVAIENVKILAKAATGDLTMKEALDKMGCNTTAMVGGLASIGTGTMIGAAALSWIPVVGSIVGGVVGGVVGYMAGSKAGETVYKAAKTVAQAAKNTVKKVWEGVKSIGRGLRNLLPW